MHVAIYTPPPVLRLLSSARNQQHSPPHPVLVKGIDDEAHTTVPTLNSIGSLRGHPPPRAHEPDREVLPCVSSLIIYDTEYGQDLIRRSELLRSAPTPYPSCSTPKPFPHGQTPSRAEMAHFIHKEPPEPRSRLRVEEQLLCGRVPQ